MSEFIKTSITLTTPIEYKEKIKNNNSGNNVLSYTPVGRNNIDMDYRRDYIYYEKN